MGRAGESPIELPERRPEWVREPRHPPAAPGACSAHRPIASRPGRPLQARATVDAGHLDAVDPDAVDRLAALKVLRQGRAPAAELDTTAVQHQVVGAAGRALPQWLAV